MVIVPQFRFGWVHEYEDDSRNINTILAAAPVAIPTSSPDEDWIELGVGVSARTSENTSAYFDWDTPLGHDELDGTHTFTGGVRFRF